MFRYIAVPISRNDFLTIPDCRVLANGAHLPLSLRAVFAREYTPSKHRFFRELFSWYRDISVYGRACVYKNIAYYKHGTGSSLQICNITHTPKGGEFLHLKLPRSLDCVARVQPMFSTILFYLALLRICKCILYTCLRILHNHRQCKLTDAALEAFADIFIITPRGCSTPNRSQRCDFRG